MFSHHKVREIGRNIGIYLVGLGFGIVGALGVAGAVELSPVFAWPALVGGLALVLVVHERFDGPI